MPIVFAPLVESPETTGDLSGAFAPLRFFASDQTQMLTMRLAPLRFVSTGISHSTGDLVMRLAPLMFYADNVDVGIVTTYTGHAQLYLPPLEMTLDQFDIPVPQAANGVFELPALVFEAAGSVSEAGVLIMTLQPLEFFASEASAGNYLIGYLPPLQFLASEPLNVPDNYLTILAQPFMSMLGNSTAVITSSLATDDDVLHDVLFVLNSTLQADSSLETLAKFIMAIESNLFAEAFFRFALDMAINETLTLTDAPTVTPEAVLALASELMLQDQTMGLMTALVTVASSLVLIDQTRFTGQVNVASAVDLADAVTGNLALITQLVSDAMLLATTSGLLFASMLVSSELDVDDSVAGFITALMSLEDGVGFSIRFTDPDGTEYIGYALNTRNAAMVTLPQHFFNSMAVVKLGGRQLTIGAGKDGVYSFGGDTFDGDDIDAKVRLGLTDFGTSALKRVANSYLGYTSDGQLKLVVTTTDGGKKKDNWYKLKARSAHSVVDGRMDIAKGLTARYFGFTIENIEGADFEIDKLQVWPMIIQRRKSGR